MKRSLCILLAILTAVLYGSCSSGSGAGEDVGSEQLTYYYTEAYEDDMVKTIRRYNRWCTSHASEDMKIRLIEFDNYETMSQRLNIEVMSGGGPDLFSNYMDLPFEKLIQSGAFYDLNELIENDTAEDKLDLSAYNQTLMNAGVYDGKRYFVPVFYRLHSLIAEREMLEKFQMPTQQGFRLTFDNMDEVFAQYLKAPDGCSFMDSDTRVGGVNADTIIFQLVNAQVDVENSTAAFDETFTKRLELLTRLRELAVSSGEEDAGETVSKVESPTLFSTVFAYSNPIWMERMISIVEDPSVLGLPEDSDFDIGVKDPVMYTCFENDENTYSASIVDAVFVNAKTKKDDKVLAFLKYLLGAHLQNLYSGTDEEYWSGGDGMDCLPVLNSAYENCIRDACKITDIYGSVVMTKEELSPITQALIDRIGKINSVELHFDLTHSNYDRNVVIPILQDYWDGKIDAGKCSNNLSSATGIYILE